MNKTHLASVILAALYPISHNNAMYQAGELLEVAAADAVFLKLSKCVREPTSDELKACQELHNPAPTAPVNDGNELPQRTTATDEPNNEGWDDKANAAPQSVPETVRPEPVEPEPVEATQPEAIESVEVLEPEPVEVVEVEAVDGETAPEASNNPYDGWLKKDLNAELDKRGIEHDAAARNDDLELLLINDDNKKANA